MLKAHTNKKIPCMMADNLLLAPKDMLAELRTITCVTGKPPIKPDNMLPKPWALSSWLVGVTRRKGSSLSVASTHNKVSKLATIAMTMATLYISMLRHCEKSG